MFEDLVRMLELRVKRQEETLAKSRKELEAAKAAAAAQGKLKGV